MKGIMNRLVSDERGAALVLAVILLLVGGLIVTPLLAHMGSGIVAGEIYENRTGELYAADAGIEDGIWKIQHPDEAGLPDIPCGDAPWDKPLSYGIPGLINENSVHVSIEYLSGGIYRIVSTASDEDSHTTIESYAKATLKPLGEWDWDVVVPEGGSYPGGKIEEGAKVYAEGDLTVEGIIEDDSFVYVEGDLTVDKIEDGSTVYVEGNLVVTGSGGIAEDNIKVCVGGNATIPKIETGPLEGTVEVYVKENLTVSGKIEDATTTVCVGGNLEYGSIQGGPTIHATGFEPFDQCPICCWDCLAPEFGLVVDILTYEVGAVV